MDVLLDHSISTPSKPILSKKLIETCIKSHLPLDVHYPRSNIVDSLTSVSNELLSIIISYSTDLANQTEKKDITNEIILQTVKELGYERYRTQLDGVVEQLKIQKKEVTERKKLKKRKLSPVEEEELRRKQNELFNNARAKQN